MTYRYVAFLLSETLIGGVEQEGIYVARLDKFYYVRAVPVQGVLGAEQERRLCADDSEQVIHVEELPWEAK